MRTGMSVARGGEVSTGGVAERAMLCAVETNVPANGSTATGRSWTGGTGVVSLQSVSSLYSATSSLQQLRGVSPSQSHVFPSANNDIPSSSPAQ